MNKMRFESKDCIQDKISMVGQIFPNCISSKKNSEGREIQSIDFSILEEMLGKDSENSSEQYELTWVGKKNAIAESNKCIRKTLRPEPDKNNSSNWNSTKNIYIEGDNIEALKLLQESYINTIKVIFIDPPYNTGNDFIYVDDFTENKADYEDDLDMYDDDGKKKFRNTATNGRFHSDWCSMIYSRLLLARNLLKEDGCIFICIDDNEQANLKKICDEVFGEDNFVNCFIWNCSTAGGIRPKYASKTHEYIYCYARNKLKLEMFWAPLSSDAVKMYSQKDEKGLYRDKDFIFKNKSKNINQKYEIKCPDGEMVHPKDGYIYRFIKSKFEESQNNEMVTFKKTHTGPLLNSNNEQANWNIYIKKYLGDASGAPATLIPKEQVSIYNSGTQCVQDLFDGVRVFENVKPVNLIQYFVNMVSSDNDIVMDFFSGSATTAQAVMQINIEQNKNLSYILVQIPDICDKESDAYNAGYSNICEIGKERIRRSAKKLCENNPKVTFDSGFRDFKIDESNMKDVYYAPEELGQQNLDSLMSNIKEDRTDLDLLFGCVLDWGLPLSLPYTSEKIGNFTVHTYNDGDLIACFDENISEDVIKTIAKRHPLRAVFRDSSFANSPAKINVEEIFKLLSPDTSIKVI